MNIKYMSTNKILHLKDKLEIEIDKRTNNISGTLTAIREIEKESSKIIEDLLNSHKESSKIIENLMNSNKELKKLKEMGFSVVIHDDSLNISIINYAIEIKPGHYYGCGVDLQKKYIYTEKNTYINNEDFETIKQILKLKEKNEFF